MIKITKTFDFQIVKQTEISELNGPVLWNRTIKIKVDLYRLITH